MLSKKSNTKEYLNNKTSQTRDALEFARERQYCYKLKFSPLLQGLTKNKSCHPELDSGSNQPIVSRLNRITGWVLTQQKRFSNFLCRQESVLAEVLTNCAQTLDPHQEIQVLAALKPNFYPLPMERRGKWYMELSRLSTPPVEKRGKCSMKYSRSSTLHIVKMGIPLSKGEGRVRVQHGGVKNSSRPICSINAGLEVRYKKC